MPLDCICAPECFTTPNRPAFVGGHPGHELKVFGWMSEHKPLVHILTDGAGRSGVSRLPSSVKLLQQLGAEPGAVFGLISDAGIYRAILEQEIDFFLDVLDRLAGSFVGNGIDFVAGDAAEGFNPAHDICRALVNAAVMKAQHVTGKPILSYEVRLAEGEYNCRERQDTRCLHLRLNDQLLRRKLDAAEAYVELRYEVRQALLHRGEEYFRIECLQKITDPFPQRLDSDKPFYETWGEERVAQGEYESVIRFQEHILPILAAIQNHAAGSEPVAFSPAWGS